MPCSQGGLSGRTILRWVYPRPKRFGRTHPEREYIMSDSFDLPLSGAVADSGRVELFKSYRRFSTYFEGATRMRVVTYCDSPEFVLELFDEVDSLERLEVVVGDITDYRERLIDKPELADRLERLKREDKLVIYLCENKEVHSKLYLIEYGEVDDEAPGDPSSSRNRQWTFGDDSPESGDGDENASSEGDDSLPRGATAIIGSPNLSKNAWSRQANTGVVIDTTTATDLWHELEAFYEVHREYNNDGPFLDDLTERLDSTDTDREEVVTLYTEGRVKTRDEISELHGKLDDRIEAEAETVDLVLGDDIELSEGAEQAVAEQTAANGGSDPEADAPGGTKSKDLDPSEGSDTRINLSLLGHSEEAVERLSRMTDFDASIASDSLSATPRAVQQYKRDVFDVPTMRVAREGPGDPDRPAQVEFGDHLTFHADGTVYRVGQPLPEPERVDAALASLEEYFETVDKYGNCNDPDAVKAHMAEALLWMMWAPFANRAAAFYSQYGIDLDKALPKLYIYGESDAGKGTFAQFALSLISGGRVQQPVDADEVGKRRVRATRSANTAFPVVVDDITKDTVNRMDTFRNYWGNWTPEASYPLFAFISNDKRPDEWFRNRAKILQFDVNFDTSLKGEAEVNRLIEQDNPLFLWFTHELLSRELRLTDDADTLRDAREVMADIYDHAGRPLPDWFPRRPAEEEHDAGRDRWHDLLQRDDVETEDRGDTLRVSFPEEMTTETYAYARDPPTIARVERRGRDLLIKSPDEFLEWLGEPPAGIDLRTGRPRDAGSHNDRDSPDDSETNNGIFGRVRKLF